MQMNILLILIPQLVTKVVGPYKTTFYLGVESENAKALAFHLINLN